MFLLVKCVKICLSFRKNSCSVLHLGPQSLMLSFGPLQKKFVTLVWIGIGKSQACEKDLTIIGVVSVQNGCHCYVLYSVLHTN